MGSPTVPTVKRLFAVSGNCCAFPKCSLQLVDSPTGKVTGRICHIKARQPGGPRYDPAQTEEERHSFENLLLLCPIHHDVIDDDPQSYTVERLTRLKADHELSQGSIPEPNGAVFENFITQIEGNTVAHGSIIFTQNQMGGQVAHSIQNFGPQPRQLSQAASNSLVAELRKLPAESIELTCIMGDQEGYQLASYLKQVLELGGWHIDGINQSIFSGLIKGVIIETPSVRPGLNTLLNWLGAAGLKPQGSLNPSGTNVKLIIGANL